MEFSQQKLIQKELKIIKQGKGFFSSIVNGSEENRMKRPVKMQLEAPLLLFAWMKNTVEMLPNSKFEFELQDAFLMAGMDITDQFGKKISPASLHTGLMEQDGKPIHDYIGGTKFTDNDFELQDVMVSLPYGVVLRLEWIAYSMSVYVQKRRAEIDAENEKALKEGKLRMPPSPLRMYRVEDMLRIQFTKIVLDALDEKHPDLADKVGYFVKKGAI